MTERDRLIADSQRLEWLADARLGPAHMPSALNRQFCGNGTLLPLPRELWQRGLSSALAVGRRLQLIQPAPVATRPGFLDSMLG